MKVTEKKSCCSNEPATEMGLMPQRISSSGGHNALSNLTVECVKKFFLEVSWVCSGIKDVVILRRNGQKVKLQNLLFLSISKYTCEGSSKNLPSLVRLLMVRVM